MYGTIARLHPKPGVIDNLQAYAESMSGGDMPAGYRSTFVFVPDTNPYEKPTAFLVAVFDDQATYRANAESPEQDARYRQMRDMLDDDPEWIDGTFYGAS